MPQQFGVRLPPVMLRALDTERGDVPRSVWIRAACRAALSAPCFRAPLTAVVDAQITEDLRAAGYRLNDGVHARHSGQNAPLTGPLHQCLVVLESVDSVANLGGESSHGGAAVKFYPMELEALFLRAAAENDMRLSTWVRDSIAAALGLGQFRQRVPQQVEFVRVVHRLTSLCVQVQILDDTPAQVDAELAQRCLEVIDRVSA